MSEVASPPPLVVVPGDDLADQSRGLLIEGPEWISSHWPEIAVALAAGCVIYLLLQFLKRWAQRVCERGEGVANWYSILGRALAKTGQLFMITASARLVVGYSEAPPAITATVTFLFTIAAVFQAAIWAREIVFGAIEDKRLRARLALSGC
jgi:hypothetical protein